MSVTAVISPFWCESLVYWLINSSIVAGRCFQGATQHKLPAGELWGNGSGLKIGPDLPLVCLLSVCLSRDGHRLNLCCGWSMDCLQK